MVRIFSGDGWLVGGDNFFWVILVVTEFMFVAEFWWKVLCGFAGERERERERQKGREEREMEEKREKLIFFFLNIICWYSLYYFNKLYVKIEIRMLGKL